MCRCSSSPRNRQECRPSSDRPHRWRSGRAVVLLGERLGGRRAAAASPNAGYETLGAMIVPMIAASRNDSAHPMTHTPTARAVLV